MAERCGGGGISSTIPCVPSTGTQRPNSRAGLAPTFGQGLYQSVLSGSV